MALIAFKYVVPFVQKNWKSSLIVVGILVAIIIALGSIFIGYLYFKNHPDSFQNTVRVAFAIIALSVVSGMGNYIAYTLKNFTRGKPHLKKLLGNIRSYFIAILLGACGSPIGYLLGQFSKQKSLPLEIFLTITFFAIFYSYACFRMKKDLSWKRPVFIREDV